MLDSMPYFLCRFWFVNPIFLPNIVATELTTSEVVDEPDSFDRLTALAAAAIS